MKQGKNTSSRVDRGWDKMQPILARELPQKKERSKFVFWIWGIGLLLSAMSLIYLWTSKAKEVVDTKPLVEQTKTLPKTTTTKDQATIQELEPNNSLSQNKIENKKQTRLVNEAPANLAISNPNATQKENSKNTKLASTQNHTTTTPTKTQTTATSALNPTSTKEKSVAGLAGTQKIVPTKNKNDLTRDNKTDSSPSSPQEGQSSTNNSQIATSESSKTKNKSATTELTPRTTQEKLKARVSIPKLPILNQLIAYNRNLNPGIMQAINVKGAEQTIKLNPTTTHWIFVISPRVHYNPSQNKYGLALNNRLGLQRNKLSYGLEFGAHSYSSANLFTSLADPAANTDTEDNSNTAGSGPEPTNGIFGGTESGRITASYEAIQNFKTNYSLSAGLFAGYDLTPRLAVQTAVGAEYFPIQINSLYLSTPDSSIAEDTNLPPGVAPQGQPPFALFGRTYDDNKYLFYSEINLGYALKDNWAMNFGYRHNFGELYTLNKVSYNASRFFAGIVYKVK